MKKYKLTILTLIVLAFSLVVSGCLKKSVANQNTNQPVNENQNINATTTEEIDTSDWLTYKNKEYGYELKYPKDWKIQDEVKNNVILFKDKSGLTISTQYELGYGTPPDEETRGLVLSGKKVIAKDWTLEDDGRIIQYHFIEKIPNWIECSSTLTSCNMIDLKASSKEDFEVLEEMINTFKFIK